jgi:hypothetical protein
MIVLTGCGAKKEEGQTTQDSVAVANAAAPGFFNIDSLQQEINNAIQFQRQELRAEPGKIKGYLARLDPKDPVSIPLAVHFIEGYPESPGAPVFDSLYFQFVEFYYKAAAPFTEMFNTEKYANILNKDYDSQPDAEALNFRAYLDLYSIKADSEEGQYEAEADPEFFYNVFAQKATPALHDYLVIQKKELAEGFEADAGLTIEYPQVYERVEAWGKFMKDHKGHRLCEDALLSYRVYLQTLLYGMDNSPVFEEGILTADIKKLYENIQQQGKDSISRKIITDYYGSLSKNGFKKQDEDYNFMNQYNLEKAFATSTPEYAK